MANWVPDGVDVTRPSAARMYDYLLGGGHNFAADRQLAARVSNAHPGCWDIARLNRAFLRRVVLELGRAGVRQFLDIGSGIPTVGNVHEIAQGADPEARVVYVDHDPVAVAHCQLILEDNPHADVVRADLREPESVLGSPTTRQLLDLDQPVGLLMVCVAHFIPTDDDPVGVLGRFREGLAPGSYLALSHLTADSGAAEMDALVKVMQGGKEPIHPRSKSRISELFGGFDLVEPGVVPIAEWRPSSPGDGGDVPERHQVLAGMGVKR
ncbi:MAG TPA: SAM-dependent methyltransferase [Pseudonocardiaceae bacterium]